MEYKKFVILLFVIFILPVKCFANINVAFTIDNNYALFSLLTINSILKHNTSNSKYTFYIVHDGLTNKNINKMKSFVEKNNQKINFIFFDTSVIKNGHEIYRYSDHYIPTIAMARIFLPDMLPDDEKRVLYLDSDMYVATDLSNLYNIDLGNYPVAMSKNYEITNDKVTDANVNSGMMLFDLDKWRNEHITKEIISYYEKNYDDLKFVPGKIKKGFNAPCMDQNLINLALENRIKVVSNKWNNQILPHNQGITTGDPECIFHYIHALKPWTFNTEQNIQRKLYIKEWSKSSFAIDLYICAINRIITKYIEAKDLKIKILKAKLGLPL